ncbi:putative outer membrane lipoprotein [Thalassovita gelatinovora]|uniref:Putative outer membrane lipoprotein n=1 Tax=Thalassovita gelatinovora TaxID=53501 RepID=A0A0P1FZN2_THAGE|nr:phosphate ABC transporter substrate-binding/OmpA family protein [Thalassovita gelatinovora]QIZ81101.1 OmpA family protein [Thalassovita gelatinovora]CUH64903.1 putative outer membrane lipoprotein [Thalassovita gelatinovora]SEP89901.1 phosphate ABC transporter substrate-binding protein, PhoT family [Thalassovita gelatinovora]
MTIARAAILAALFLFALPPIALAQDVTLMSRDGSVEISGTLLGFDGEYYRVDTIYGELTVDGSGVNCDGPACPSLTDYVAELQFSGAGSMGRVLLPALIEVFARKSGLQSEREIVDASHTRFILTDQKSGKTMGLFTLRLTNSDEGFADLLANEADIAMTLRELRPDEAALSREAGLGDMTVKGRSRVLALDALVPVVAPGNPLTRISASDLSKILSGEISNWAALGGPDAPVTLHLRNQHSGLWQAADDRLLRPVGKVVSDLALRYDSDPELVRAVERDPFGIGLTSVTGTGNAKPIALSGNCGFAMYANRKTIKTEDYPLTAPMFLYLPARRLPKLARDFLTFTRSNAAQIVIRRAGFTDQIPEEIAIDDQGARFANAIARSGEEIGLDELKRMVELLSDKTRLSLSFRFETGSARLDAHSRSNVEQLALALETGAFDTRQLLFVGFSDGDGSAVSNLAISLRRAKAVLTAVKKAAETANFEQMDLQAEAFGEAMPMACDDSAWGRKANRRVEVWLR